MFQLRYLLHCMMLKMKNLKCGIVTGIDYKAVVTERENIFYHCTIGFFNKLELNNQKYHQNRTTREKHYKVKFLFPIN